MGERKKIKRNEGAIIFVFLWEERRGKERKGEQLRRDLELTIKESSDENSSWRGPS